MKKIITVHYDKVESDRETGIYFSVKLRSLKIFYIKYARSKFLKNFLLPTRSLPSFIINIRILLSIEYLFQKKEKRKQAITL